MKRTCFIKPIPDMMNKSVSRNFTQIPIDLLKNPNVSSKAKTILFILLSNKNGWTSYLTQIKKYIKEKDIAIQTGLKELQQHGYLFKNRYRHAKTKKVISTFWAYTDHPYQFGNFEDIEKILKYNGWEWYPEKFNKTYLDNEKLEQQNLNQGFLKQGNQALIILKGNYINNNHINNTPVFEEPSKIIDLNKKYYLCIAKELAKIISTHKKININSNINKWVQPIKLLMTKDLKINGTQIITIKKRITKALKFYKNHIGEKYIPVIESGESLRNKFIKLENAMDREKNNYPKDNYSNQNKTKPKTLIDDETMKRIKAKTIVFD